MKLGGNKNEAEELALDAEASDLDEDDEVVEGGDEGLGNDDLDLHDLVEGSDKEELMEKN